MDARWQGLPGHGLERLCCSHEATCHRRGGDHPMAIQLKQQPSHGRRSQTGAVRGVTIYSGNSYGFLPPQSLGMGNDPVGRCRRDVVVHGGSRGCGGSEVDENRQTARSSSLSDDSGCAMVSPKSQPPDPERKTDVGRPPQSARAPPPSAKPPPRRRRSQSWPSFSNMARVWSLSRACLLIAECAA